MWLNVLVKGWKFTQWFKDILTLYYSHDAFFAFCILTYYNHI